MGEELGTPKTEAVTEYDKHVSKEREKERQELLLERVGRTAEALMLASMAKDPKGTLSPMKADEARWCSLTLHGMGAPKKKE